MDMTRRHVNPKGTPIKKPSKRIIYITGTERPSVEQKRLALEAVKKAVENNCLIITSDLDGIDAEVIRATNKAKYKKVIVWGALCSVRYGSNYGHNELAKYGPSQRDDVCVAKSGTVVIIGKNKRLGAVLKFGTNIGRACFTK